MFIIFIRSARSTIEIWIFRCIFFKNLYTYITHVTNFSYFVCETCPFSSYFWKYSLQNIKKSYIYFWNEIQFALILILYIDQIIMVNNQTSFTFLLNQTVSTWINWEIASIIICYLVDYYYYYYESFLLLVNYWWLM